MPSIQISVVSPKSPLPPKKDILAACAIEVQSAVIKNFEALDKERSRYGHSFYIREGASRTNWEYGGNGDSAVVTVYSVPMKHKLTGGPVRPVNGKYLSIPVSNDARARAISPRRWPSKLFPVKTKKKTLFLAQRDGKGIIFHFLLASGVVHRARPETIPDEETMRDSAVSAVNELLRQNNL